MREIELSGVEAQGREMLAAAEVVAWRNSVQVDVRRNNKRAWGADAHQLMQLMMAQINQSSRPARLIPDLLGDDNVSESAPSGFAELILGSSPERQLRLDLEGEPLPSHWEKCLDLKTGDLYFVNRCTGVTSSDDPRGIRTNNATTEHLSVAHEFLGSKKSETIEHEIALRASITTSSRSPQDYNSRHVYAHNFFSSQGCKQPLTFDSDDWRDSSSHFTAKAQCSEELDLKLDLNLSTGGTSGSFINRHDQAVCTVEMIQSALKRVEEKPHPRVAFKHSLSPSYSSLTSACPEAFGASPSISSSSSTSSRSSLRICEAESTKAELNAVDSGPALVTGVCTRCFMYVMLNRWDPKCPRCNSQVPVYFSGPLPSKRPRHEFDHQFSSDGR